MELRGSESRWAVKEAGRVGGGVGGRAHVKAGLRPAPLFVSVSSVDPYMGPLAFSPSPAHLPSEGECYLLWGPDLCSNSRMLNVLGQVK